TAVTWETSDTKVATVTTGGTECVVTAVATGTATITAKAGDKTATCTVTVNAASTSVDPTPTGITGISFSRAHQTFEMKNSPWELSVMTSPAGVEMGPNDSIEWSVANQTDTSSDEKNWPVITVPAGGNGLTARMEGKIPGNFTVTARYVKGGSPTEMTAQLNVSISGILLNTDKVKMLIGENRVLVVDRPYGEAASSAYDTFWTSSDPSVVSVNNNGELLAWKLGTAIITANKNGYTATCEVTVGEDEEVIAFGPYYATTGNPLILIEAADELDTISRRKTGDKDNEGHYISGTGAALNYITNLSVPASQGTLYYNYNSQANTGEGVGAVTRFARHGAGSILSLGKLYFVPRQGFSGTAEISFNGWALNGESFSGSIRVQVTATSTISYSTHTGEPVFFISEDFNTYCRSLTGRDLNYVTFNLPQASQGTLYYNYANANRPGDRVTGSTQYSRSGRTAIESVCFLPNAAFIGRAVITFRGVDTAGQAFTGEIEVTVSDSTAGETANVYISGQRGQPVTLRADLFSDACQSTIRDILSYVTFKLPAYNEGTLFYNYQNASSPGTRVDAGTRYYYSGVPGINGITFVPASNSTGRVAVTYTGYGVGGATFTGTVYISIGDTERATVRYFVPKNGVITFNAVDFSSAAVLEMGVSMEYVTFRVPDAIPVGALYYDYQGDWYYNYGVYSNFEYYRSPKESYQGRIDLISFHAGASAGSVTIPYTAYSAADGAGKRESFTGSVIIQVGSPTPEDVKLTANVGDQLWLPSDRLAAVCTPVMDKSLAYIEITGLPPASEGRLYSGYLGFNTGAEVKRGDRFYCMGAPGIDQVSFVPHGGFTGEVEITYVGFSSDGQEQLSGRILVTVTNSDKSRYFNDMTSHFWAIDAVDFLYRNNTVMGIGDDRFNPTGSISKGDFALMLVRAFKFTGDSSVRYLDVPEGTYYTEAISIASQKGVAGGSNGYFHPLEALSRQDAMLMIYNALKADGRLLTNGLAANLDGYHDEKQISAEAREAVGCLVQMGIVKGDGNGYLNPQARLNRAETAVLLHAVMTL
ncbi:MAG: S-layer homology domain-containing protein, partial [Oscillospiraceae bacterium]|nr:S-layer homology domain-containing protein [Oscillospiraceae bacterium]